MLLATPPDADAAALARRHAPIVVHDRREQNPLASVAAATVPVPGTAGARRRPTVYARAVPADERGRTWIQYWLFHPDNTQDRGIVRTGRHEGDWELAQILLSRRGRPLRVVVSQHSGAESCRWGEIRQRGSRPVLFSAHASHALYFEPGTRDRTWPDPNDEALGDGRVVRPRVVMVSADRPAWMAWPGRWGASRSGFVPGEMDSPRGPRFQGVRWADPDAFAASADPCRGRTCDALGECDLPETVMAGALTLAVTGMAFAVTVRRRRRRDAAAAGGRSVRSATS